MTGIGNEAINIIILKGSFLCMCVFVCVFDIWKQTHFEWLIYISCKNIYIRL